MLRARPNSTKRASFSEDKESLSPSRADAAVGGSSAAAHLPLLYELEFNVLRD
jgi:hypothetical protein